MHDSSVIPHNTVSTRLARASFASKSSESPHEFSCVSIAHPDPLRLVQTQFMLRVCITLRATECSDYPHTGAADKYAVALVHNIIS
jgi:hypothetical protein